MPTVVTAPKIEINQIDFTPPSPKKPKWAKIFLLCLLIVFTSCFSVLFVEWEKEPETMEAEVALAEIDLGLPDFITPCLIEMDGVSRSGMKLEGVKDIAVHYVANPGTSAMANRNWFNSPESETSSHFIVGLEGEVILCVPLDEKSCATNERNRDTISVEVCHPDETGAFAQTTYDALIRLLTFLCEEYELSEENLIRHYDVTGKMCPLYYVENPDAWEELKSDVRENLNSEK